MLTCKKKEKIYKRKLKEKREKKNCDNKIKNIYEKRLMQLF